jgi:hypothetical protein
LWTGIIPTTACFTVSGDLDDAGGGNGKEAAEAEDVNVNVEVKVEVEVEEVRWSILRMVTCSSIFFEKICDLRS